MVQPINTAVSRFLQGGNNGFVRMPPEPRSRVRFNFNSLVSGVSSIFGGVAAGAVGGINPEYMTLINKQVEMQEQMQLVSLSSNIEKSRHESQMAAIRNIRAN